MMHIEIRGASAACVQPVLLTAGMVGARVRFSFDESWAGLTRCAVFTDGMVTRDVLLEGESCALVTDAGMPAISDPGEDLVALCH